MYASSFSVDGDRVPTPSIFKGVEFSIIVNFNFLCGSLDRFLRQQRLIYIQPLSHRTLQATDDSLDVLLSQGPSK